MRLPRLTTRRLMVLVAVVAVAIAFPIRDELDRRRAKYLRLAAIHREERARLIIEPRGPLKGKVFVVHPTLRTWTVRSPAIIEYRIRLEQKYERAARYPWLPIAPDPPPPE